MTKNYFWVLIFGIVILVFSCDPYFRAEIKNESKDQIQLMIKFDSISLHKYWSGRTYIPFLNSYPNYIGIKAIKFDTINLVKTYVIKPDSLFPLQSGMSPPDFELFESLTIIGKDTIVLRNKGEMDNAFSRDDNNWRKLIIK